MPEPSDLRASQEALRAACLDTLAAYARSETLPTPLDQYLVQGLRQVLGTLDALDWPAEASVAP